MGRATEFFDYINRETTPTERESNEIYFSLTIAEDIKKARKEYRKELKEKDAGEKI